MIKLLLVTLLLISACFAFPASLWLTSEYKTLDGGWWSNPQWADQIKYKMAKQPDRQFKMQQQITPAPTASIPILINSSHRYQTISGIGASFQHSSIYNFNKMSPAKRHQALQKFISSDNGIGMTYMRICLGTSDFTYWPWYTYDDNGPDPQLKNFSIQKDIDNGIISLLQEALSINPRLKIMASPWSAPAWMKTNNKIGDGGYLKQEYFAVAAKYYRMAVQAYAKQGIPIHAITMQNQPGLATDYPSMLMSTADQIKLGLLLAEQFANNSIKTGIYVLDHNFNMAVNSSEKPCAKDILANAQLRSKVKGTALHDYVGQPISATQLHNIYPDMDIVLSQRSNQGLWGAARTMEYFKNWCTAYTAWVIFMDSNKQPYRGSGQAWTPPGIQDANNRDKYWLLADYYLLGMFTKFIVPGSIRIHTDLGDRKALNEVAFLTPSGQIVLLLVNQSKNPISIDIKDQSSTLSDVIEGEVFAVYKWSANHSIEKISDPIITELQRE